MSLESSVSGFLEQKVESLNASLDHYLDCQRGLRHALSQSKLSAGDYHLELEQSDKKYGPIIQEHRFVKYGRKTIEEDMEELSEGRKWQKADNFGPDFAFLERAYAASMATRVMAASTTKVQRRFNQQKFKSDVIEYLSARDPDSNKYVWCHVLGWAAKETVKAAHLVPKSLHGDELSFLFGVKEVVSSDPRNGFTLSGTIEEALDKGDIAILPVPPVGTSEITKWKCIVVKQSLLNQMFRRKEDGGISRWKDIDGVELRFRSDNRPARRYLYFRFVITYLQAKKNGLTEWTQKIEKRQILWPSMGEYLAKSTLITLGRNISGSELPDVLIENNTFDSPSNEIVEDLALAASLRKAMLISARAGDEVDDEYEDEDDDG